MVRMGSVIGVNAERIAEYRRLHAAVWPGVLAKIAECNIRNIPSTCASPRTCSSRISSTTARLGRGPGSHGGRSVTQEWWSVCMPCQAPLASRAEGEWWAPMDEVFHVD
jgi:L-rhamnose mutarotase